MIFLFLLRCSPPVNDLIVDPDRHFFGDPFGEDTPEEILRLREIAGSLTGRLADVYEAMLIRYAGGKERITTEDLARKWNVSISQIGKDRAKIIRMIREEFNADSSEKTVG